MVDAMRSPVLTDSSVPNQKHFSHSPPSSTSARFMGGAHHAYQHGHLVRMTDQGHGESLHRQGFQSFYHNVAPEQQQADGRGSSEGEVGAKGSPSRPQSNAAVAAAAAWRIAPWGVDAEHLDQNQLRLQQQQQQRQLLLEQAKQRQHAGSNGPSSPSNQQQQSGSKSSFPREVGRNMPFAQFSASGSGGNGATPVSWSVAVGASSGVSSPSPPTSPPLEGSSSQAAAAAAAAAMTAMFAQQRLQDGQRPQSISPPLGAPSSALPHSSVDELAAGMRLLQREQSSVSRSSPPLPTGVRSPPEHGAIQRPRANSAHEQQGLGKYDGPHTNELGIHHSSGPLNSQGDIHPLQNGYHSDMLRAGQNGSNMMIFDSRHSYGGAAAAAMYAASPAFGAIDQQAMMQAIMAGSRGLMNKVGLGVPVAANGHPRHTEHSSLERTFLEEWERMEAAAIRLAQMVVNYEMRQGKASGADKPSVEKELEGANGAYFRPGAPVCVHFLQHGVCTWKSRVCPNSDTHHCGRCGRPHGTKAHAYLTRVLDSMSFEKNH